MPSDTYLRIYAVVRRIPRGRVTSYGDVARRAGLAGAARQVGYALHALPTGSTVPWWRVLNAAGRVSLPPGSDAAIGQRLRLEREGVRFDDGGRVRAAHWWGAPGASGGKEVRSRGRRSLRSGGDD